MKKDYLWDKTGEDSEIENLEHMLKEFRSENTAPPELPARTYAFEKTQTEKPRRFFQFALATFASVALVLISVGVFQFVSFEGQDLAKDSSEQISVIKEDEANSDFVERLFIENVAELKEDKPTIQKAKFTPKPKVRNVKKQVKKKVYKSNKFIAKKIEPKPTKDEPKVKTIKVTKEEKEAYDKLMEALAITGSQMRMVQEKINGVE